MLRKKQIEKICSNCLLKNEPLYECCFYPPPPSMERLDYREGLNQCLKSFLESRKEILSLLKKG